MKKSFYVLCLFFAVCVTRAHDEKWISLTTAVERSSVPLVRYKLLRATPAELAWGLNMAVLRGNAALVNIILKRSAEIPVDALRDALNCAQPDENMTKLLRFHTSRYCIKIGLG